MISPAWIVVSTLIIAQNPNWPLNLPDTPIESLALLENMPSDPDYYNEENCAGQFELYSFTPNCAQAISKLNRGSGVGIHADSAWLFTTGNPKIKLGIFGDAISWNDIDLVGRWGLNRAELSPPLTSTSAEDSIYDRNEDGAFTVLDYTSATGTATPNADLIVDKRLLERGDRGDANQNGILDPEDLIIIFSNGLDEDQNGKIDDICGWDFVENDSNVGTSTNAGKKLPAANLRARAMVGEANNGIAGIGVCPKCLALPIRVHGELPPKNADFANGLRYAGTSGLSIVPIYQFPRIDSPNEQQELDQIFTELVEQNLLVVLAAGTESSAQFELPWELQPSLVVGEISPEHTDNSQAKSFFAASPCSNFGPQVDLVAPGQCDGGAASLAAGAAGLILSAAQGIDALSVDKLQVPLSPGELRQVLTTSSEHKPEENPESNLSVSQFRSQYSYGRINVRTAIEAIVQRNIAPVVRMVTPSNFSHVNPTFGKTFMVSARVENFRHDSADWTLEYAVGIDAASEDFLPVSRGLIREGEAIDVVGEIPSNALFSDTTAPPFDEFTHALTIRISASTDVGGSITRSESRRIVFVHRDLYSLPAFPKQLESPPASAAVFVDLDEDGKDEIVVVDQAAQLQAFDGDGNFISGWPIKLALSESKIQLSYGNLNPEEANCFVLTDSDGKTDVIDLQGKRISGFPVVAESNLSSRFGFAPVLYDLDEDGQNEIVVASEDGILSAFNYQGELLFGFPIKLEQDIGPLAAGHFGDRKTPGLVALSHDTLYLIQKSSSGDFEIILTRTLDEEEVMSTRRTTLAGPVITDLDKNGQDEIIFVSKSGRVKHFEPGSETFSVRSVHERSNFGPGSSLSREGPPIFGVPGHSSLGDLNQDGRVEIIHPASTTSFENFIFEGPLSKNEFLISAWDAKDGSIPRGFPIHALAQQNEAAQIIDLDRDRRPEVIFSDGRLRLQAKSIAGVSPKAWPKRIDGALVGPISVGDIDNNGLKEILATTNQGTLFVWRSLMRQDALLDWPYPRHDLQATGNYNTGRNVVQDTDSAESCSCQSVDYKPSQAIKLKWLEAFLLIGFVFWLRRHNERLRIRN